jgi:hypothetical protein
VRTWAPISSLIALACTSTVPPPGENIGDFLFEAQPPAMQACGLSDVPDGGFEFTVTFSRTDAGAGFITINGVTHAGTFDGRTLSAAYSAPRAFANCMCGTLVNETMTVELLSQSQDEALGGVCPATGVPAPVDFDAGITPPMRTSSGFDATRGCGTLVDALSSDPVPGPGLDGTDAGCWTSCNTCVLTYTLVGERK